MSSYLLRSVLAGPRDKVSGLPQYVDVFGQVSAGGAGVWSFRSVTEKGQPSAQAPVWHLRRGFGSTEAGLIVVGVALALAHRPGAAGEVSQQVIRRRRLDPRHDVAVVPELVEACRPLRELPLALVVTSDDEADGIVPELRATGWSIATSRLERP